MNAKFLNDELLIWETFQPVHKFSIDVKKAFGPVKLFFVTFLDLTIVWYGEAHWASFVFDGELEDLKFDISEKYLYFEEIFHDLSNEIRGENTPFEYLTELDFDSVDLEWSECFLGGLSEGAFDDFEDADVFILCFDHEVIFGDGSEWLDVGDGKWLVNVAEGFVSSCDKGEYIEFHFVTADDKL